MANSCARAAQRIVLPRHFDAVDDALKLLRHLEKLQRAARRHASRRPCQAAARVEHLIADFIDAYWLVPLHPRERPFQVAMWKKDYLVFLRTGQGAKASSLTWGTFSAAMGRLAQSLFHPDELRLQVYTDDPLAVVSGTKQQRDRLMTILLCTWMILGLKVAFHKATRGQDTVWIGARLLLQPRGITVTASEEMVKDITGLVREMLLHNYSSLEDVRKLAGKSNHIAGLIQAWRPFLAPLWAAITKATKDPMHPQRWIWRRQIIDALTWIQAFLQHRLGAMTRTYELRHHFNHGIPTRIIFDASGWGLGGALYVDSKLVQYFPRLYPLQIFGDLRSPLAMTKGNKPGRPWRCLCPCGFGLPGGSALAARFTYQATTLLPLFFLLTLRARGQQSTSLHESWRSSWATRFITLTSSRTCLASPTS